MRRMSDKQIREEGREMEKGEGETRTRVGVWRRGGDEEGERERGELEDQMVVEG